jgi:hypothetical protein
MAALLASAAHFERKAVCLKERHERGLSGMNRAYPQVRDHRRSGVTKEKASTDQAHHE